MMIPMKYAATFINGCAFKPEDWGNDGLPIVRIAQLTGGDFDNYFDGLVNTRHHIDSGDLLFAWSATLDSFIWQRGPAYLNQHTFKVLPKNSNDRQFLYYSLKHYAPLWADIDAHGSTTRHIKRESLGNKIWLPDLKTQKVIADYLDREIARIDNLIIKKELFQKAITDKHKALTAALVDGSLIYGATRAGHAGWFGKLPRHWPVKRARFLFREHINPSLDGLEELLTVSHITGVTARSDKNVTMFLAETLEGYKLVQKHDLVVNTMWAWMGAMGVSPIAGCISPSYAVYRPKLDLFFPKYLDLVVRSLPFVAEVNRRSKGIWGSRLRLYPDAFMDIAFPLPPLDEQKQLVFKLRESLKREEQIAETCQRSIALLRERRSALITAAVSGQVDVSDMIASADHSSTKRPLP